MSCAASPHLGSGLNGWSRHCRLLFALTPGTSPAVVTGFINAAAIGAPLVVGIVAAAPSAGGIACIGAYLAAFTNKGGPRKPRTGGLAVAAILNTAAFSVGVFSTNLLLVNFASFALLVFVAAMGSAFGATLARCETMPATAFLTGVAAMTFDNASAAALLFACGGLWYALATMALTPAAQPHSESAAVFAVRGLVQTLRLSSATYRHAVRTTLIASGLLALTVAVDLPHGQWAVLAVLRVARPESSETTRRASQRVIGNIIGGLSAAACVTWLHSTATLVAMLLIAIAVGFALRPVNYALWVLFGTPLILLIGDLSGSADWHVAVGRIAMTIVGVAAALMGRLVILPDRRAGNAPPTQND